MSLELLTDAHVSMCRIDVQTSRSRDKGKVKKAKTLFALSPILFFLPKKLPTGSHFQGGRLFLPPKFSQLSPKFKELNRTFCLSLFWTGNLRIQYFTTNASLALLTLMFLNIHRLFLMAVPDKVIFSILKLLFAEPVL